MRAEIPRVRARAVVIPALAAVVVAVVALLVKQGTPAAPRQSPAAASAVHSGAVTVAITNYAYVPDRLTVRVGTRVTWTNHDSTAHTATANGGAFDTGTINPSQSRSVLLSKPGTYPYHCIFHAFMTGSVTVVR